MALPTMVPMPMEFAGPNASPTDVKSSGAEEPAARNVAPATSGVRPRRSEMTPSAGSK